MNIQAKDVIAFLVLAGSFVILALYVARGQTPPDVMLLIVGPAITGVLAYYFGAHNGNITGLAASAVQVSNMASQLASQAIEKRATPAAVPAVIASTPPGGVAPAG